MIIKIESESVYNAALARAEKLWNAEGGTPDGQELDRLATLIEEYESIHYPIDPPSKEASIRFREEQPMQTKGDDS